MVSGQYYSQRGCEWVNGTKDNLCGIESENKLKVMMREMGHWPGVWWITVPLSPQACGRLMQWGLLWWLKAKRLMPCVWISVCLWERMYGVVICVCRYWLFSKNETLVCQCCPFHDGKEHGISLNQLQACRCVVEPSSPCLNQFKLISLLIFSGEFCCPVMAEMLRNFYPEKKNVDETKCNHLVWKWPKCKVHKRFTLDSHTWMCSTYSYCV